MELLHAVEADGAIFEPSLEGFCLWPVLRSVTWQVVGRVSISSTVPSLWRRLLRQPVVMTMPLYAAWAAWQRMRLRRRSGGFMFHSVESYRSVRLAEGWWNVYLDDIANALQSAHDVLWCEERVFAFSPWRTVGPRHLFTDGQMLDMSLGAVVVRDDEARRQADVVLAVLSARLAELDQPLTAREHTTLRHFMVQGARRFRRALRWYRKLMQQLAPRVLVLTNAYNEHGVVAAARERGLPVVEFQHGQIHPNHPGYMWTDAARAWRRRLAIPDQVATYGAYWSGLLTRSGFWRSEEVPAIGSISMDRLRHERSAPADRDRPQIIFTTQFATRSWTVPLLREFIDRAEAAGVAFDLIVKVHRGEHQYIDEYRALARGSRAVRVLSAYEGDTLALIAASDVHVSGWSTCHFESVGLGTPTVVLRSAGTAALADLEQFAEVWQASSAEELLEAVQRIGLATGAAPARGASAEALFRPGALRNAVALLKSVDAEARAGAAGEVSGSGRRP